MTQTTVYTGKVWTGVADDDWVEAFAVEDGRIIAGDIKDDHNTQALGRWVAGKGI